MRGPSIGELVGLALFHRLMTDPSALAPAPLLLEYHPPRLGYGAARYAQEARMNLNLLLHHNDHGCFLSLEERQDLTSAWCRLDEILRSHERMPIPEDDVPW